MHNTQPHFEKALLGKIAKGDEKAFEKFFDLYKKRFYSVVLKMTRSDQVAEEIVQDVFLNIWQNRSTLGSIDNPSSYFFTAVYRRVYLHYRKIAQDRKLLQVISQKSDSVNTTDEMVLGRESEQLITQAIMRLPPQQQLIFKLSKQEGMDREEIARQLHISPNTVKNHLTCALKFIRTFLRNPNFTILITFWLLKK